ncbi:MAG: hypothetical protein R2806_12045 [Saprospiraceae bacterium]
MGFEYRGELLDPPGSAIQSIGFSKIQEDPDPTKARFYFRHITRIRFDPIHGKIFGVISSSEAGIRDIEKATGWKSMDIKNYHGKS